MYRIVFQVFEEKHIYDNKTFSLCLKMYLCKGVKKFGFFLKKSKFFLIYDDI